MSFKKHIAEHKNVLTSVEAINEVYQHFISENNTLLAKIQVAQLDVLLRVAEEHKIPNFLSSIILEKDGAAATAKISALVEIFTKAQVSNHIYAYFLHAIYALKMSRLENELKFIHPSDYNVREVEKYGYDRTFGVGTYLETSAEFKIEGKTLYPSNIVRPIITIPTDVTTINEPLENNYLCRLLSVPRGVTELPENFLRTNDAIEKVILNDKITNIPAGAFSNMPKFNYLLSDKVTHIASRAFTKTNLSSTAFGAETVLEVGDYAFSDNRNLETIDLKRAEKLGKAVFFNSPNIKKAVLRITPETIKINPELYMLFSEKPSQIKKLEEVVILFNDKKIPDRFFAKMKSLKKITLLGDITHIGAHAFEGCTSLEELNFNFVGEEINENAFAGMKELASYPAFPNVTKVGAYAFKGLNLTKLTLNFARLTEIGEYAFSEALLPRDVELGEATIGRGAFENATGLEVLKVHTSLFHYRDEIDRFLPYQIFSDTVFGFNEKYSTLKHVEITGELVPYLFAGWRALETVVIRESVTEISQGAFSNCTNLKSITMPANDVLFAKDAFKNCKNLTAFNYGESAREHVFKFDQTKAIMEGAFSGIPNIKELVIDVSEAVHPKAFSDLSKLEKLSIRLNKNQKITKLYELFNSSVESFNQATKLLTTVNIKFPTNEIPREFFAEHTNLKTLNIIGVIKTIGLHAFRETKSAESITFNFTGTFVPEYTFNLLPNLKVLPTLSTATEVGKMAFANCDLRNSSLNFAALTKISEDAFKDSLLPSELILAAEEVSPGAFLRAKGVTKLSLKDNLFYYKSETDKFLPSELFSSDLVTFNKEYANLTEVTLAGKLVAEQFKNWRHLQSITLLDTQTIIPRQAFAECTNLTKVTFNHQKLTISDEAFLNAKNLSIFGASDAEEFALTLENITAIGARSFAGVTKFKKLKLEVSGLINEAAFSNLTNLEVFSYKHHQNNKINRLHSLFTKTSKEFNDEYKTLTNLNVFFTNRTIPAAFFSDLTRIKLINIINEIKIVEGDAFRGLISLVTLKLNFTGEEIKSGTFNNVPNLDDLPSFKTVRKFASDSFSENKFITKITISDITDSRFLSNFPNLGTIIYEGKTVLKNIFRDFANLETFIVTHQETVIQERAFQNARNLTTIVNLDKVSEVGSFAFSGTALKNAEFNPELKFIGVGAFQNVKTIETIKMPAVIRYFGALFDLEQASYNAPADFYYEAHKKRTFYVSKSLQKVEIIGGELAPSMFSNMSAELLIKTKDTIIPAFAFYGVNNLTLQLSTIRQVDDFAFKNAKITEFDFSNIKVIGQEAFSDTLLTKLYIGPDTVSISHNAFIGTNLMEIDVINNARFSLQVGTLINRNAQEIIYMLPERPERYVVPDEVTKIYKTTFPRNTYIKELNLNNVTTIEEQSFSNLNNLEVVTFKESVKTINNEIFSGNFKLHTLNIKLNEHSFLTNHQVQDLFSNKEEISERLTLNVSGTVLSNDLVAGLSNVALLNLKEVAVTSINKLNLTDVTVAELTLPDTLETLKNSVLSQNNVMRLTSGEGKVYVAENDILYLENTVIYVFPTVRNLLSYRDANKFSKDALINAREIQKFGLFSDVNYENNLSYLTSVNTLDVRGVQIKPLVELIPTLQETLEKVTYNASILSSRFFSNLTNLQEVELQGTTDIATEAFLNTPNLKSVTGTEKVISLAEKSFSDAGNISALQFTSVLETLPANAFINTKVNSFSVTNNSKFVTNDGFVIDRELGQIIARNKELPAVIHIKEKLSEITAEFLRDLGVRHLTLEDVTKITKGAFVNLTDLRHLAINNASEISHEIISEEAKLRSLVVPFIGYDETKLDNFKYFFTNEQVMHPINDVTVTKQNVFDQTFIGISKLRRVRLLNATEIKPGTFFESTTRATVYVPIAFKKDKNTEWRKVSNRRLFGTVSVKYIKQGRN